jgi:uncharacterized protein YprB with RNaseH-like and TPR domain
MKVSELAQLTKKELIWLGSHRCKHGHAYLSHWQCYKRDILNHEIERVGIFDIEASGLDADFAFMLSYGIKDSETGKVYGRSVTEDEIRSGVYDKKLCEEMVRDFRNFDRLVVYYGRDRRFDLPFTRTRCVANNVQFPLYGEMKITDLYDIVKNKLKLGRSSLHSVCNLLGIKSKQHPLNGKIWYDARTGKQNGLDWVWKHNVEDLESTVKVFRKIRGFQRKQVTSI